jgi:hypothetical protein
MSELPSLRSSDDTTRPVCIRPGAFSFLVKFKRLCLSSVISVPSWFNSADQATHRRKAVFRLKKLKNPFDR